MEGGYDLRAGMYLNLLREAAEYRVAIVRVMRETRGKVTPQGVSFLSSGWSIGSPRPTGTACNLLK